MNLPDYNFLSAPLWLVTTLHIVTLTLHFLAMNFLLGGVIIVLLGKFTTRWHNPTVQTLLKLFPNAMAATITFGVAPLLFVQLVFAKQIYSASIVSAWFWLMIMVVAIVVYYFLYASSFSLNSKAGKAGTYLTIGLVGLIYVSFVYSSVFSLAERPSLIASLYAAAQSGLVINTDIGAYIFRWLHMLLGAVTVGAFFVGLFGKNNEPAFAVGKKFYLWAMVAAMVLGLAYLFTMGDYILPFMRSVSIWLLLVSIVLSLGSLHFFFKKKFVPAALMLIVSLVGMVTIRHLVRLIHLDGLFDPASIPFRPQWSIFAVFLVCFVIAVGLVWYMFRLYFTAQSQPGS
ncbi:MAG: hypothetical protein JSU74_12225 [Candidatus Zixiibacteriota bacterium]|nr:MAG: hypothetical protein JSU74_12225 [candidate division Zixibacteria bacterium]